MVVDGWGAECDGLFLNGSQLQMERLKGVTQRHPPVRSGKYSAHLEAAEVPHEEVGVERVGVVEVAPRALLQAQVLQILDFLFFIFCVEMGFIRNQVHSLRVRRDRKSHLFNWSVCGKSDQSPYSSCRDSNRLWFPPRVPRE